MAMNPFIVTIKGKETLVYQSAHTGLFCTIRNNGGHSPVSYHLIREQPKIGTILDEDGLDPETTYGRIGIKDYNAFINTYGLLNGTKKSKPHQSAKSTTTSDTASP